MSRIINKIIIFGSTGMLGRYVYSFFTNTEYHVICINSRITNENLSKVEEWLEGKSVRGIKTALAQSRDLELDNEKRSVALMKKWDLNIDIDDYIRKANAYVMFYNYMYHSRKCSSHDNSPYSNPNIISKMSNKFNMRYKQMSERLLKLYKQENI